MKHPITNGISIIVAICVLVLASGASADIDNAQSDVPEKNGTYNDPGHPGIKVRVFVHHEKPTKFEAAALTCNLPDPDSTSTVGSTGWHLPSSWTYQLNPSSVPATVGGTNLPTIAANGFADWTNAVSNRVTITRGTDTTISRQSYDNRNIIAWGRTSGSALGVTYVRYNTLTGQVVDVDTIMNKKFSWKWSNSAVCAEPTVYDAENILTHELGHWLGLDDEYDTAYQHATMYGYGAKGEVKKNTLTLGDIAGALAIYP